MAISTIPRPKKRVVAPEAVAQKKVVKKRPTPTMDDRRPNQEQEGFDRNYSEQIAEVLGVTESGVVDRQMEQQDVGERPKKKIAQHRSTPMMADRHLSEDVVDEAEYEADLAQDDESLGQDEVVVENIESLLTQETVNATHRYSHEGCSDQDDLDEGDETLKLIMRTASSRSGTTTYIHLNEDKPKGTVAQKKDDDFDLNDFTSSTGVLREKKTVTVKLASYLDSRNCYRVHPNDIQESVYCCECKDENDNTIFYLVSEDVAEDVEAKTGGELKLMTVARLLDSTGAETIYLAAKPDPSRSDLFNQYATTRAEFLEQARESWASLKNNKDAYRYDVKIAGERTQKMLEAKDFSSRSFGALIKEVFEGRIVKNQDHPLLQEEDI